MNTLASVLFAGRLYGSSMLRLPQQDAPAPHWPWWLRIIAVVGALLFVQMVARGMRRGSSRSGPSDGE
jgi:hypothetical protein